MAASSTGTFSGQNGPKNMYKVKPFYGSTQGIEIPDVMYKMKNIHGGKNEMKEASTDPVSALESRQESILGRLADIKQILDQLTDQYTPPTQVAAGAPVSSGGQKPGASASLKASAAGSQPKAMPAGLSKMAASATASSPLGEVIHDIVINADPASPPLSLFVLYEALQRHLPLLATSYVHSSMKDVDPRLCNIIKSGSQVNRGSHKVALSLVWKKVPNGPTLMVSPCKQSVVEGEVNIARYLNRIMNPGWDSEDIAMATQVDEWLDTASCQLLNGNAKEKAAALRNLNSRLGRNDWLVGSAFSLADIVTWSALHQSQQAGSAPANVKKWLKACSGNPLLQTAVSLL